MNVQIIQDGNRVGSVNLDTGAVEGSVPDVVVDAARTPDPRSVSSGDGIQEEWVEPSAGEVMGRIRAIAVTEPFEFSVVESQSNIDQLQSQLAELERIVRLNKFEPEQHPRGPHGKFIAVPDQNLDGMSEQQRSVVTDVVESAHEKGWTERVSKVTTEPHEGTPDSAIAYWNPHSEEMYLNPDKFTPENLQRGEDQNWLADGSQTGVLNHEFGHARHRDSAHSQLFSTGGGSPVDLTDEEREMLEQEVSKMAAENVLEAIAEIHAGVVGGETFSSDVMDFYEQFGGPDL